MAKHGETTHTFARLHARRILPFERAKGHQERPVLRMLTSIHVRPLAGQRLYREYVHPVRFPEGQLEVIYIPLHDPSSMSERIPRNDSPTTWTVATPMSSVELAAARGLGYSMGNVLLSCSGDADAVAPSSEGTCRSRMARVTHAAVAAAKFCHRLFLWLSE